MPHPARCVDPSLKLPLVLDMCGPRSQGPLRRCARSGASRKSRLLRRAFMSFNESHARARIGVRLAVSTSQAFLDAPGRIAGPSVQGEYHVGTRLQADRTHRLLAEFSDDAVCVGLEKASKTLRNMHWFEVVETRGHIEEGKILHWQVRIKVGLRHRLMRPCRP